MLSGLARVTFSCFTAPHSTPSILSSLPSSSAASISSSSTVGRTGQQGRWLQQGQSRGHPQPLRHTELRYPTGRSDWSMILSKQLPTQGPWQPPDGRAEISSRGRGHASHSCILFHLQNHLRGDTKNSTAALAVKPCSWAGSPTLQALPPTPTLTGCQHTISLVLPQHKHCLQHPLWLPCLCRSHQALLSSHIRHGLVLCSAHSQPWLSKPTPPCRLSGCRHDFR